MLQDWQERLESGRERLKDVRRPILEQANLKGFEAVCKSLTNLATSLCPLADWLLASLRLARGQSQETFRDFVQGCSKVNFRDHWKIVCPSSIQEQYTQAVPRLLARLTTDERPVNTRAALQPMGSHRILFPTHFQGKGYLVWAEVTVYPAPAGTTSHTLEVAPDTFYLPVGKEWHSTRQNLPSTLRALCLQLNPPLAFVLRLLPLGPDDLEHDGSNRSDLLDRQWAAWLLSNPTLEVEGPSLGLAVALAAWAASEDRTVKPVVATGVVLHPTGDIAGVGAVPEKLRAFGYYRDLAPPHLCPIGIFPDVNRYEKPADVAELLDDVHLLWWYRFSPEHNDPNRLLTDGFDDYRRRREPARVSPQVPQPLRENAANLETPSRHPLVARFNDRPDELAGEVLQQLDARLGTSKKPESARPIRIDVPIEGLARTGRPRPDGFPRALAEALQEKYGGLRLTVADVASALRHEGKLALVVHDEPSGKLWTREEETLNQRVEWFRLLWRLGGKTSPADHWKQQHIFAVFSDRHHSDRVQAAAS